MTKPATPVVALVVTIPAVITQPSLHRRSHPAASASGTQELHLDEAAPVPAGQTPAAAAATTTYKSTGGGDSLPITGIGFAGIGFAGAVALAGTHRPAVSRIGVGSSDPDLSGLIRRYPGGVGSQPIYRVKPLLRGYMSTVKIATSSLP